MSRAETVRPTVVRDSCSTPVDYPAEQAARAVLGQCLLDPLAVARARSVLGPRTFFQESHRRIFAAMIALDDRGEAVDLITVSEEMRKRGESDPGIAMTLSSLVETATTTANLEAHARIVVEASASRVLRLAGLHAADRIERGDPAGQVAAELAVELEKLSAAFRKDIPAETILTTFRSAREVAEAAPNQVPWIVPGYVARGAISELAGKVKIGKTTLLGVMAAAVLNGGDFLGRPCVRTKVIWLTEQPVSSLVEVLRRAGLERQDDLLLLTWGATRGLEWPDLCAAVVAKALDIGAGLIFVDTLPVFAGLRGDAENDAGSALEAMEPLQTAAARDLGILVGRHERKAGGDVGDSARGSSAFSGAVDVLLSLRRPQGASRPTLRVVHTVSRFDGADPETLIEWVGGTYVSKGNASDAALSEARAAILDELPDAEIEAVTFDDLLPRLPNVKRTTAQATLKMLLGAGLVRSLGAGRRGDPKRYCRMVSAGTPFPMAAESIGGATEREPIVSAATPGGSGGNHSQGGAAQ